MQEKYGKREPEVRKTAGNSTDDSSQNTFAELGVHPLEPKRDTRKLKRQLLYEVQNMPKKEVASRIELYGEK